MNLFEAIISLESEKECKNFLKDLCTPKEIKDLNERWEIAKLLNNKDLSYREISKITGASLTTVTRVSRFLKDEKNNGYKSILNKMSDEDEK